MSIVKKLASDTVAYGASSILARFVNYLFGIFIIKFISTNEYGQFTAMYASAGFLLVVLTHGMETSYFRFINKEEQKERAFSTGFFSILFVAILFFIVVLLCKGSIANFLKQETEFVLLFAGIMCFDALCALPYASLRLQNRPILFATIKIGNIIVFILINCIFFILLPWFNIKLSDSNLLLIFVANLLASILTFIALLPQLKQVVFSFNFKYYKIVLLYALPIMLVGITGMINEMLDRLMMVRLLPYDDDTNFKLLGIYGFNYKLAMPISMFLQAFRFAAEPIFFKQANNKDNPAQYAQIMKFFVLFASLIFLAINCFMPLFQEFITWYQPKDAETYFSGLHIVPILLLANLCLGMYFNVSTWYKIKDKTYIGAIISTIGATITLILLYVLVPSIGYVGAAWATFFCYLSMLLIGLFLENKYYPIPHNYSKLILYIGFALILFFSNKFFSYQVANSLWLKLTVGLFHVIVYSSVAYFVERNHSTTA